MNTVKGKPAKIYDGGNFIRDYIFIDDLINGILMLTLSNLSSGTEMNFGSNLNYSASDIVSRLERILGLNIPKKLNAYPKNSYDQGDIMAESIAAGQQWGQQVGMRAIMRLQSQSTEQQKGQ